LIPSEKESGILEKIEFVVPWKEVENDEFLRFENVYWKVK
jgi:hypothetical protein